MKNYVVYVLLACLLLFVSSGRLCGQSLERKVFASQGGMTQNGAYYFSFTIGEPVIGTDNNTLPIFTKGFEQPIDPTVLASIHRQQLREEQEFSYQLYPNPTHGKLIFRYQSEIASPKRIVIYNELGQQVFSQSIETQALSEGTHLDLHSLPGGSYWLLCSDQGKKIILPFRKE